MKNGVFLLIFAAAAAANPIYTVADLGGLGGPATGYAINNSGTVAGWAQSPSGGQQAFVSTPSGMQALSSGRYESTPTGSMTQARWWGQRTTRAGRRTEPFGAHRAPRIWERILRDGDQ